jgi:hypothetical protein
MRNRNPAVKPEVYFYIEKYCPLLKKLCMGEILELKREYIEILFPYLNDIMYKKIIAYFDIEKEKQVILASPCSITLNMVNTILLYRVKCEGVWYNCIKYWILYDIKKPARNNEVLFIDQTLSYMKNAFEY